MYLNSSLYGLMIASILFTIVLIIASLLGIFALLKQKKISEVKSDFINNMTHEFKTPIATISLAADSIFNPKVLQDKEQIKYYTGVIKEENARMNSQVENVLQMSLLDKKSFHFDLRQHELNKLLGKAIANIRLHLEQNNGKIDLDMPPDSISILVDDVHFLNVMNNILDNAIKHCDESPHMKVKVVLHDSIALIEIEDNGIGMDRQTQARVFDKFYRFERGNIHNVKGFGLGLSYAKAVMLAFGGDITVKSETGVGSTFTIKINTIQITG